MAITCPTVTMIMVIMAMAIEFGFQVIGSKGGLHTGGKESGFRATGDENLILKIGKGKGDRLIFVLLTKGHNSLHHFPA